MKPTLYILAAGMGSRYGGLKQLDPVGPQGQTIMDYSVYDALRAGFGKIVFVIRKDFEDAFREKILSRYADHVPVELVFQSIDSLPEGFAVPDGRTKPWGTGHAVLMGAEKVNEPFAVINADDYYGRDAFATIGKFLASLPEGSKGKYCMVGFHLGNTMTLNGSVSRGVCTVDADGCLRDVKERTAISYDSDGAISFTDENGTVCHPAADTPVSMNLWGFTPDIFEAAGKQFVDFLGKRGNELKSEFYIPTVVDTLIKAGEADCKVLRTSSKWFGVTYPEDRDDVMAKLASLHKAGEYPDTLF